MAKDIAFAGETTLRNHEIVHIAHEWISADDYVNFLRRSALGEQYPREDFESRIATLVENVQISLIARDQGGCIVGVLFGLTDFAYWLFLACLGVDRRYERSGLGSALVAIAHDLSGGVERITLLAYSDDNAFGFYEKIGLSACQSMMEKSDVEWTDYVVE